MTGQIFADIHELQPASTGPSTLGLSVHSRVSSGDTIHNTRDFVTYRYSSPAHKFDHLAQRPASKDHHARIAPHRLGEVHADGAHAASELSQVIAAPNEADQSVSTETSDDDDRSAILAKLLRKKSPASSVVNLALHRLDAVARSESVPTPRSHPGKTYFPTPLSANPSQSSKGTRTPQKHVDRSSDSSASEPDNSDAQSRKAKTRIKLMRGQSAYTLRSGRSRTRRGPGLALGQLLEASAAKARASGSLATSNMLRSASQQEQEEFTRATTKTYQDMLDRLTGRFESILQQYADRVCLPVSLRSGDLLKGCSGRHSSLCSDHTAFATTCAFLLGIRGAVHCCVFG